MGEAFRSYEKRACGPNMAQHYLVFAEEARAKDGPVARIAFARGKSGTVTAWVLWIGGPVRLCHEAKASGYGYDKRTLAVDRIGRRFWASRFACFGGIKEHDFALALLVAFPAADWQRALEKRGFIVFAAN
jgi:hypothetical protein